MKKNHTLLLCLALLAACSSKITPGMYHHYTRYAGSAEPGTVILQSTGFGKTASESRADAASNAFQTLLFTGIPGSQYELPMLPLPDQRKNHPAIKALLQNGYTVFLLDNKLEAEENAIKTGVKGKMTTCQFTINCEALRKHLEQRGLTRKFGI